MKKLFFILFLFSFSKGNISKDSIFLDFVISFNDTIQVEINGKKLLPIIPVSDTDFLALINISKHLSDEKKNHVKIIYRKEELKFEIQPTDSYRFYNIYFLSDSLKPFRVKKSKKAILRF